MQNIRICILVADKLDEMEVIVPFHIWKKAQFIVELISIEKKNTIVLENGLKISCHSSVDNTNLSQYNAIYLPGGMGYLKYVHPKTNPKLKNSLVKDFKNKKNKWILANSSASLILAEWNLHEGCHMTSSESHKEKINDCYIHEPIVSSGNLITSNGPGSAIDFALNVIDIISHAEISKDVCQEILYKRKNEIMADKN
ncbi:MAG: DJ-1/PfpI family protein [Mycoplasmoidaceae bacterium]